MIPALLASASLRQMQLEKRLREQIDHKDGHFI